MSTRENIRLIARAPLAFVIMSTRENIRLIANKPIQVSRFKFFSFYMCLVVTCWERADLLALVCGV